MDLGELRDLYQEMILDHSRRPRNFRVLETANRVAEGHNPVCGDHVAIFAEVEGDRLKDLAFQGRGCAISQASASLLTTELKGKTLAEAEAVFRNFHLLVTGEREGVADRDALGKLAVFQGVCEFPIRVKCASLPWHALRAALEGNGQSVTTE
jgi:nitrogen fixation NifU-like protein